VSSIPYADDVLDPETNLLSIKEAAALLAVPASRVQQMIRDGQIIALKRDRVPFVPADFFDGEALVKGLVGTITVLSDSGFGPSEMLRWLFAEDDTLPGRPIDALRGNRGTEVKRRAQAMAF
jgi:hypothetical protein